jgi:PAS domain S-box-containing protein
VVERSAPQVALHAAEERLRAVAQSGIVGLFFWGVDGSITDANDAFLAMLGYTRDDLAGRARRLAPADAARVRGAATSRGAELLATGRHGQYAKEYVAQRRPARAGGGHERDARRLGGAGRLHLPRRQPPGARPRRASPACSGRRRPPCRCCSAPTT